MPPGLGDCRRRRGGQTQLAEPRACGATLGAWGSDAKRSWSEATVPVGLGTGLSPPSHFRVTAMRWCCSANALGGDLAGWALTASL